MMERWNQFIGKKIKVIYDDCPYRYPKQKTGVLLEVNDTHLSLQILDSIEALRLSDVRRIEILEEIK